MNRIKQLLLWIINITATLFFLFFGILWAMRLGLDYNSEGRHFDEASSVVYDQESLLVYCWLTAIFGILGTISWIITWKLKR